MSTTPATNRLSALQRDGRIAVAARVFYEAGALVGREVWVVGAACVVGLAGRVVGV